MPRPSSVDKLPPEVREEIGRLRSLGWTIDQILEHLRALFDQAPSRSALGRHIQGLDKLGEKMRRSRQVAEALVRELGTAPESQAARLNIELLHSAILDLHMRAADGEDGIDPFGKATLAGNPEGAMMLAKALDHLSSASKRNVEFMEKVEARATERAKKEAATAVEVVAKQRGIGAETLEAIKVGIFGVRAG